MCSASSRASGSCTGRSRCREAGETRARGQQLALTRAPQSTAASPPPPRVPHGTHLIIL
jgi:hypothetical protein